MVSLILRLFDCLAGLMRLLGVNYPQFRAILEVKLTLDGRRQLTALDRRAVKKTTNSLLPTLVSYSVFGLGIGVMVLLVKQTLPAMIMIHGFIMIMTAMTLVADFSSVLLDSTDNAVLLPRPVDGRTILAARVAHISTYLALIVLSLAAAPLIFGTFAIHPAFAPVFLATLVCSTALVVCLASIFYLLAARLMNVEKLRDIIVYFQILMTVAIFAGYQLLPRLLDSEQLLSSSSQPAGRLIDKWWIYLVPPAWLAAPIDMLAGSVGTPQLALTVLAIVVPALSLCFLVFYLAPRFTESLAALGTDSAKPTTRHSRGGSFSLPRALAGVVARDPTQRAAFELTWQLCSRDRKFKLRTYPMFAMVFVMGVSMLANAASGHNRGQLLEVLRAMRFYYFFLLYFGAAAVTTFIDHLSYSDNYEAAWVYAALPVRAPGLILMGALKAVLARFILPMSAILAAVTMAIWGLHIWPDVAVAISVTFLISLIQALLLGRRFPFSRKLAVMEGSGRANWTLVAMLCVAILAFLHYLLSYVPLLLALFFIAVLIATLRLGRAYARTSWITIERQYD